MDYVEADVADLFLSAEIIMAAILPCVTFGQIAEVLDAGEMSKSDSYIFHCRCITLWRGSSFGSSLIVLSSAAIYSFWENNFRFWVVIRGFCRLCIGWIYLLSDDACIMLPLADGLEVQGETEEEL